jgi:acyl dehydratase
VVLDRERFARWRALFPAAAQAERAPPGLLMALFMNGFAEAFAPHPDGNIHAGQTLAFTGRSLRAGDGAQVSVTCREKEIKRGRNRVRFEARMCNDAGDEIMSGEMLVIWAV